MRRDWNRGTDEDVDAVERLIALLSLDHVAGRSRDRMSGGERQRVPIGRALAQEAAVITLDQPTIHLNARHQHHLVEVLTAGGRTTVVVLHDLHLAAAYCTRVAILDQGRLIALGDPGDVPTAERVSQVYGLPAPRIDLASRPHRVLGR